MARTIQEIEAEIITAKEAKTELNELTSSSLWAMTYKPIQKDLPIFKP